jgi:hypothetical protein
MGSDSCHTLTAESEGQVNRELIGGVLDQANRILDEMLFGYKLFFDIEDEDIAVMTVSGERVSPGFSENIVLCFAFYFGLLLNHPRGKVSLTHDLPNFSSLFLFLDYDLLDGISKTFVNPLVELAIEVFSQVIIVAKPCHFDCRLDNFLAIHPKIGSLNALVCMIDNSGGVNCSLAKNDKICIGNYEHEMYAVSDDRLGLGEIAIYSIF